MVSLRLLPYSSTLLLQWGIVKTEIKMPTVENPMLTNILPLKPGVGQNKAMHASPTARNFFLVLILDLPIVAAVELFFLLALKPLMASVETTGSKAFYSMWNLLALKPFMASVESTGPKATYGICGIYWPKATYGICGIYWP